MAWSLFLDDERFPSNKTDNFADWIIARTVEDAIYYINTLGVPYRMSLDHDLGENMQTGFDFMEQLVDMDLDGLTDVNAIESFYVHSQNPVGAENINGLFNNYIREKNRG